MCHPLNFMIGRGSVQLLRFDYLHCDIDKQAVKALS
jgi:hypothetical protein